MSLAKHHSERVLPLTRHEVSSACSTAGGQGFGLQLLVPRMHSTACKRCHICTRPPGVSFILEVEVEHVDDLRQRVSQAHNATRRSSPACDCPGWSAAGRREPPARPFSGTAGRHQSRWIVCSVTTRLSDAFGDVFRVTRTGLPHNASRDSGAMRTMPQAMALSCRSRYDREADGDCRDEPWPCVRAASLLWGFRRLLIRWNHARGSGRGVSCALGCGCRQPFRQRQQREDDRRLALTINAWRACSSVSGGFQNLAQRPMLPCHSNHNNGLPARIIRIRTPSTFRFWRKTASFC